MATLFHSNSFLLPGAVVDVAACCRAVVCYCLSEWISSLLPQCIFVRLETVFSTFLHTHTAKAGIGNRQILVSFVVTLPPSLARTVPARFAVVAAAAVVQAVEEVSSPHRCCARAFRSLVCCCQQRALLRME